MLSSLCVVMVKRTRLDIEKRSLLVCVVTFVGCDTAAAKAKSGEDRGRCGALVWRQSVVRLCIKTGRQGAPPFGWLHDLISVLPSALCCEFGADVKSGDETRGVCLSPRSKIFAKASMRSHGGGGRVEMEVGGGVEVLLARRCPLYLVPPDHHHWSRTHNTVYKELQPHRSSRLTTGKSSP